MIKIRPTLCLIYASVAHGISLRSGGYGRHACDRCCCAVISEGEDGAGHGGDRIRGAGQTLGYGQAYPLHTKCIARIEPRLKLPDGVNISV